MTTAPMTTAPKPFTGIVDLHHGDTTVNVRELVKGGVRAVIHKATEGQDFRDKSFARQVERFRAEGVLIGAYHFANGNGDGADQAEHLLRTVGADVDRTLLALDWEANPTSRYGDMSLDNARRFVERIHWRTGRWPLLYSFTSYLNEHLGLRTVDPVLANCPLWQAQFGERPTRTYATWPRGFSLWQYTNGHDGPADQTTYTRRTAGCELDPCQDRSTFDGTEAELAAWWASAGR